MKFNTKSWSAVLAWALSKCTRITTITLCVGLSVDVSAQSLQPFPKDEIVTVSRPEIGANFPFRVRQDTVRLTVDGRDVTPQLLLTTRQARWSPNYDLDQGRHSVRLLALTEDDGQIDHCWQFQIRNPTTQAPLEFRLLAQLPAQGSLTQLRPVIGCRFAGQLSSAKLWVDGLDVTPLSQKSDQAILWTPSYDLDFGRHLVRLNAVGSQGQDISSDWYFVVEHP